jgi:hypothetical protein
MPYRVLLQVFFQFLEFLFEPFQLFPGSRQYGFLHLEFLTGYQIEFADTGLKDAAKICFQILAHGSQTFRNRFGQFSCQIVD